jgi:hypothetical protein
MRRTVHNNSSPVTIPRKIESVLGTCGSRFALAYSSMIETISTPTPSFAAIISASTSTLSTSSMIECLLENERRLWSNKEDIWRVILSYLDNPRDIFSWSCVCSQARNLIYQTRLHISFRNHRHTVHSWNQIHVWLTHFSHLLSLEFSSCNCKEDPFLNIVIDSFLPTPLSSITTSSTSPPSPAAVPIPHSHSSRFLDLIISKCFSILIPSPQLSQCRSLALCEMNFAAPFRSPPHLPLFTNLKNSSLQILILSNSSFSPRSLITLIDNLPTSLRLLGLGGCQGLCHLATAVRLVAAEATPELEEQTQHQHTPLHSQSLVVEMTFVAPEDKERLQTLLPHTTIVDLETDSLESLDHHLSPILSPFSRGLSSSSLWTALLSCSTPNYQRTPLHNSCYCGDVSRVHWLLTHYARIDLKDSRGFLPLHRAVETLVSKKPLPISLGCLQRCLLVPDSALVLQTCLTRNQAYENPLYVAALTRNYLGVKEILKIFLKNQPQWIHSPQSSSPLSIVMSPLNQHQHCKGKYCQAIPFPFPLSPTIEEEQYHRRYLDYKNEIVDKSCDARGYTALHGAILCRSYECCQLLLESGLFCPNYCNSSGITPVHVSYRLENPTVSSNYQSEASTTGATESETGGGGGGGGIRELLMRYGGQEDVKDEMGSVPSDYREGKLSTKKSTHSSKKKREGRQQGLEHGEEGKCGGHCEEKGGRYTVSR